MSGQIVTKNNNNETKYYMKRSTSSPTLSFKQGARLKSAYKLTKFFTKVQVVSELTNLCTNVPIRGQLNAF